MKKYIDYTEEDFVNDDYFIQWVMGSDPTVHSFWTSWLEENPQKAEVVKKAKQLILSIDFKKFHPANEDFSRIWSAIDQHIVEAEKNNSDTKIISIYDKKRVSYFSYKQIFKSRHVAATILIGVLCASIFMWFLLKGQQIHHVTEYGEMKTIVLPDNSIVKLNANSSLTFNDSWDGESREVWLNGEAYFSVMHKADNQKFLVHVDHLRIEVLGTEFNVSNRREKARVVLSSGKVKLDYEGKKDTKAPIQPIIMEPGEMVEMSAPFAQNKQFLKRKVDTERFTSWRNNQLIFKDTPIKEVVYALQDQFGIDIIIKEQQVTEHNYTGTIPLDNIDIFFTTLSKSFNVEIMKKDRQVTIQKIRGDP
ncbi:FecR family protein [Catalinimonas niigatensis]|uniref:FecR family protein n=1 Tax=Catalinimonas niigatensis TaxID=1397264 RepID=UPI002665281F|nr:FecR domain-containing protein [Catalinimonas niigatensis]WPP51908.1 FecR domain-containing protein [Catalinimonas niigatensis]